MFEAAASKFASSVGDNELIPVPNLDVASKCNVLNLVTKKYRRWAWQSPYFEVNGFDLDDVVKQKIPTDQSIRKSNTFLEKYEKINKLSVSGKLGGKLKGILEVEVHGSDSIDIETKFGEILKDEIEANDLINYIKCLHLDMAHPAVKAVTNHKRKVLCLVSSCLRLAAPGDIKAGSDVKAEEEVAEGANTIIAKVASAAEESQVEDDQSKSMVIPTGTPLAYSIYELNVNVKTGSFQLVVDKEKRGGFHGEDEVDTVEVDDVLVAEEREIYEPLVTLEPSRRKKLRDAVIGMCAASQDDIDMGLLMVKQASKAAEIKNMAHDDEKLEDVNLRFVCDQQHWLFIMETAKFQIKDGTITYPSEPCPELRAIRCLFEALEELSEDGLQLFTKIEKKHVKPLLYMFQDAVEGTAIDVADPHLGPIYREANPGQAFAAGLGFQVTSEGRVAPPSRLAEVQGAARALYALWWDNEDEAYEKAGCFIL